MKKHHSAVFSSVNPYAQGEKIILQVNGEKVLIRDEDIAEISRSKKSAMPGGLLNELTLEDISDLFAYMGALPARNLTRRDTATAPK